MAKRELLATIWDRYLASSQKDKSRILDEFIPVTGHHRKHGIRLLGQSGDDGEQQPAVKKGRRIYDESVRQAVIVVGEAADRICGKRLQAALPHLVESMERHGHLDLDPEVRQRLTAASAATLDRLLKPIRATAGSRCKRRRRQSMSKRVPVRTYPVRTYNDWKRPPPGFLEIDWWRTAAARCRDRSSTAWWPPTSAPVGPRPSPCWPRNSPWWWQGWKPSADSCPFPCEASTTRHRLGQ